MKKRRKWKYRYYRSPRTTQERRENGSRKDRDKEESYYNYARGVRRSSNLPNSYDDIPFASQKSWKKLRKTQYRPAWEVLYCGFCQDKIEKAKNGLHELDKNGKLCYYCSSRCMISKRFLKNPHRWLLWGKSEKDKEIYYSLM